LDAGDGEPNAAADQVMLLCHDPRGHYEDDGRVIPQILLEQSDERPSEQPRR
jgi:hypothetical protein